MTKQEMVLDIIEKQLISIEYKEKYLNLLMLRIDENRKLMGKLFITMIFIVFAFPLIIETKINEISVGPFKLADNRIAISIMPSIFAYCYYKYISVWIDLVEQKFVFKELTSVVFNIKSKSFLNERIRPYSFIDSIMNIHFEDKSKIFGCLIMLVLIPIILILMFFPFLFEYYMLKIVYSKFGLYSILEWISFLTPILLGMFTIIMFVQIAKKDIERNNKYIKDNNSI